MDTSDSRGAAFGAGFCENAFMIASRRAAAALSSSGVFGLSILRADAAGFELDGTIFVDRKLWASVVFRSRLCIVDNVSLGDGY